MILIFGIIFIGAAVSLTLANYLASGRQQRQEEARERREEQFLNLLESIKETDEKK